MLLFISSAFSNDMVCGLRENCLEMYLLDMEDLSDTSAARQLFVDIYAAFSAASAWLLLVTPNTSCENEVLTVCILVYSTSILAKAHQF